ncbi:IS66 family transposase [Thermoflexibacter ruber]|uniref:Transposase IS66 family protein n=1 Tax=Thermoflexibacter ruber TaxID=1003 RepID=A0A1I2IWW4_9BACT|nr:IS66 family transposase [Thermoflexibacter ruber]SFF46784.1 Transposase IS66 family protein [Thermoflexibacter ruber]
MLSDVVVKFSEQEAYELLPTYRQVFDIPEPRLEVIAHRISCRLCCGQVHCGRFPEEVSAPVQYGLRAKTFMSLLNVDYRLPYQKISQCFYDMYGYALNEGTIVNANEGLYERSAEIEVQIKTGLQSSAVVHADETGGGVAGELHWFHTVCNELGCYLFVHSKRGKEALESAASLLPFMRGYVVHDCWSSYFSFDTCKHALCHAHLLQELKALSEQGSQWAAKMSACFLALYQASQQGKAVVENFEAWKAHYEAICQQADREEPPPEKTARGRPKNSKGRNLLNRLTTYQTELLAFACVKEVPFTNNMAEQAIRGIKIKQKAAMCFRTLRGAEIFVRLQGVMTTLRKQGLNLFQTLLNINAKINVQLETT